MKKKLDIKNLDLYLRDGMSIMFGGFMGVGTPKYLVDAIVHSGVKDLTLIGNDTGVPGVGVAPLITNNQVKKIITSHIGLNPETGQKMIKGDIEVELVPQGTLIERIRCGGSGLGGFLTPTGVGTVVEEGKQKITIDGVTYLLELPLKADLAILEAQVSDELGNLVYALSARNFNPIIALAARTVIAYAHKVVQPGEISPNEVITPAPLVNHIVYPN